MAQPIDEPISAAASDEMPDGVSIRQTPAGPVYADARGRTLYGLDFRALERRTGEPWKFCGEGCNSLWEPLAAPPGAKVLAYNPPRRGRLAETGSSAPTDKPTDWVVIEGADGPQWLFKHFHLVFTRRGDQPGSTRWEGSEDLAWNTLKYVPPVPELTLPPTVAPQFVDGAYLLAAMDGRLLYTLQGSDRRDAEPFPSGILSQGVGDWAVLQSGDVAQWTYRGQPVFVSRDAQVASIPAGGKVLRP